MHWLRTHVFHFDGAGALVSLTLSAFVLPALQPWLGMPRDVLIAMAVPAALLGTASWSCALLDAQVARWLPAVVVGNIGYCLLSVVVVAWHVGAVTPLGWAYYLGEAGVMAGVVTMEVAVWRRVRPRPA